MDGLTARILAMEKENLERRVAVAHQEEALAAAEAQAESDQAVVAELTQRMGGAAVDELEDADVDWEKTQREIVRLERQLAQMGLVNPLAIEEYERDRARLGAIAGQLEDLARARDGLGQLADELSSEIDRRFEAVFGAVAFNFQETFAVLFEGARPPQAGRSAVGRARRGDPGPAGGQAHAQHQAALRRRAGPDRAGLHPRP